jgi:NAD-dependent protein deacetylase/lipoamidase
VAASRTELSDAALAPVRSLLRSAIGRPGSVCVLTGAGMSAESGIPTFRDAVDRAATSSAEPVAEGEHPAVGQPGGGAGLWSRFDPMELASEEGFRAHPQRVWDWYAERREWVRAALPNAGHHALAGFAQRHPGVMSLVTQNVDDLHQRAGQTGAIRLHGNILEDRWLDACPRQAGRGIACDPASAAAGRPPACAECGNPLRPGVVWFGESLPPAAIDAAERAARLCTLMLVVGTSGAVWPAAGLAGVARANGARVVIVNPDDSEIDDQAHHLLRGTAAGVLPRLLAPD